MMEEIRTLISEGKTVSLTVKGHSMNPFLVHLRDTITLEGWKDKGLKKGMVALVRDIHGNYLIHRIIKVTDTSVYLMGDGNVGQVEKAEKPDVIAIMKSITRKGRYTYPCSGIIWKAYSWFWMSITPLRRYPLALWRKIFPQVPLR